MNEEDIFISEADMPLPILEKEPDNVKKIVQEIEETNNLLEELALVLENSDAGLKSMNRLMWFMSIVALASLVVTIIKP